MGKQENPLTIKGRGFPGFRRKNAENLTERFQRVVDQETSGQKESSGIRK
jgi:hypothetical protein